jgi:UDP-GlcNAc:undecaprenyl-phosphate GlcNAc-1-phosphate transferase
VPDGIRKKHDRPIPRSGGSAIFLTLVLMAVAALWLAPALADWNTPGIRALMAGGVGIFAIGLADDRYNLPAHFKFAAEVAIAAMVFFMGLRIESVGLPAGVLVLPLWASFVITVVWIVALTNAFNLIDGSDGIAGGAALCSSLALAAAFLFFANQTAAFFALIIAGASLGFLFYNFPPATVFLGDSGSLLLGYSLSALGLLTARKAPTLLAIAIPVVSCGLPIVDVSLTVARRYFQRQPVFGADRGHLHHRLADLGNSPRDVALFLYAACALFALLSLLLLQSTGAPMALAFGLGAGVALMVLFKLEIPELRELNRAFNRSLRQRSVLGMNMRIREAALRLSQSESAQEIVGALTYAFSSSDFDVCEVWLTKRVWQKLDSTDAFERHGELAVWRLASTIDGRRMCSIHVPMCTEDGDEIGCIQLYRDMHSQQMLVDISLVTHELQDRLRGALLRVTGGFDPAPAREAAIETKLVRPAFPPQVA